jgi:hypothetical protein
MNYIKTDLNFTRIETTLVVTMVLATLVIFGHSVYKVMSPLGATDFHSYWYHGHYVRAGEDPYQAFFDGVVTENVPPAQPGLANTPANTAPLVLGLSIFSWLSWTQAKTLWMFINLCLTLLIPWLVIKLLPQQNSLTTFHKLLIFFVFFILQGTRIANWVGQTTLLVFFLMLSALLVAGKNKFLAGVLLGMALSKYSLAISVFLFLLLEREYLILIIGLVVQLLGVAIVSLIGNHTPLLTIGYYLRMIGHHTSLPGIHLATLFPANDQLTFIIAFVTFLAVVICLWIIGYQPGSKTADGDNEFTFAELHILSILTLWSLLAVYHRAYDTLVVIVFVSLLIYGLSKPSLWNITRKKRWGLRIFLIIFVGIMSIPGSIMGIVLPSNLMPTWYQIVSYTTTSTLIIAISISFWLLYQVSRTNYQMATELSSSKI